MEHTTPTTGGVAKKDLGLVFNTPQLVTSFSDILFKSKLLEFLLSGCKLTLLLATNHYEDEHTLYSLISFRTEVKSSACSCVELLLFLVRWNSWIHNTMHHPKKENMFLEWNQTLQLELRMLDNSNKSKEKLSIPPS
jgi:hypothetical protein